MAGCNLAQTFLEAIRAMLELGWEKDSDALRLQCSFSLEIMEWQNPPISS
jgi:hypothetical protein